jgi:predicted unusual protein kinase regulating ubiquinone biosynthesis (AarF/ABC1/UbiB family)
MLPFGRANAARSIRLTLQELGGAWAKIGQALALRFDLLDVEICYELFELLNHMDPFPYGEVRSIIRSELGAYPETLFLSFKPEPFAAASIGQVHRATLRTGEEVAVKIQRPNARKVMSSDIALMRVLASILDFLGFLGPTSLRRLVDMFEKTLADELNFKNEARHAETLARNAKGHRAERHAKVFVDYTTEHVLTTAFLDGIPLVSLVRKGADGFVREPFVQSDAICRHLLMNTLRQVFENGYFHADIHPANIIALRNNEIGYVDFGIVATLSHTVRESLAYYAMHLFRGDTDRSTQEFMRWLIPSPKTDLTAASLEIQQIAEDYFFSFSEVTNHDPGNGFAAYQINVLNAARRHHMAISSAIVASFRSLIMAITIIYRLNPEFPLRRHASLFFSRLVIRETARCLWPVEAMRGLFDMRVRLDRALTIVEGLGRSESDKGYRRRQAKMRIVVYSGLATLNAICLYETMAGQMSRICILPEAIALPHLLLAMVIVLGILVIHEAGKLKEHKAWI